VAKQRKPVTTALSFLEPSGKTHTGRTYENHYVGVMPQPDPAPTFTPPSPEPRYGKQGAAARIKPRHKHEWLVRHDYMQCHSCGKLVTLKKGRVSVDR
jgi:hypothetical protein